MDTYTRNGVAAGSGAQTLTAPVDGVTVESIDPPRGRRYDEDGAVADFTGYLHAPVGWDRERELEKYWNSEHESRLGLGFCVAGNPRRHFMLRTVRHDAAWVREQLELAIAHVEATPRRRAH
ncbi:hypothetical protein DFJ68_1581 [Terracoccus luteus]|uniref:Uncharacterized protein n=1 Tax=Terracoccus luteus TaxID=53356 RepID=A0A495Y062_9MICO|nr:hypothetical protein [Terracoccus luteus]RKT78143.1 hypothetical protein DFJ68_1581 [Terracoccus luteus]